MVSERHGLTKLSILTSIRPTEPSVYSHTGGPTQQQDLSPGQGSVFLDHLEPGTDYEVTVSALFGHSVGPAASLTARTGEEPESLFQAGLDRHSRVQKPLIPMCPGSIFC